MEDKNDERLTFKLFSSRKFQHILNTILFQIISFPRPFPSIPLPQIKDKIVQQDAKKEKESQQISREGMGESTQASKLQPTR